MGHIIVSYYFYYLLLLALFYLSICCLSYTILDIWQDIFKTKEKYILYQYCQFPITRKKGTWVNNFYLILARRKYAKRSFYYDASTFVISINNLKIPMNILWVVALVNHSLFPVMYNFNKYLISLTKNNQSREENRMGKQKNSLFWSRKLSVYQQNWPLNIKLYRL